MIQSILSYLESSAVRIPDKTAVTDGKNSYTFKALAEYSQKTGSALSALGIQSFRREPVAVMTEKSADALCAFFGVIYSGGFYVYMNPELPDRRLKQVQSVLEAKVVITDDKNLSRVKNIFSSCTVVLIEHLKSSRIDEAALAEVRENALDIDPLYANFTSGSTGIPKGVVVSHRSVIDFTDKFTDLFGICDHDVIANQAPFDFDVSVKDIYSSIKTGATLVIIPRHLFSQPAALLEFICEYNVTTLIWAVSALCLISTFHGLDYKTPETVDKVLFSGEVMPLRHLREWMSHLPNATFVNLYGPTEITCNCTYHIIDRHRIYDVGIPIGRHFPNENVFLLDGEGNEIKLPNIQGEICVSGSSLALGYYRDALQTSSSFVQNPANGAYFERIYRTGDIGMYNSSGELFFCGRKDFQIKHMGHRIELEEIERAVSEADGVERCCCTFDESKDRISCYYTGTSDTRKLHSFLREKLPVFMIPGVLKKVDMMPLTKNGKIDRKLLMR